MTTEEAARIFVDGVFRCEPDEVKSRLNCAIPRVASRLSGQAQAPGQGGRKDQPGIGHQAVVVEGDADAVGVVA